MELPTIEDFFNVAPIATTAAVLIALGWWARHKSAEAHIKDLRATIEFLRGLIKK